MKTDNRKKKIEEAFVMFGLVTAIVLMGIDHATASTWTQKADMPTTRLFFTTSVVDGKIYSIGGIASPKKVEEYDPATDNWTRKADLPTGRVWIASSAVDGKIYAIGGSTSWGGTNLATVEEYDPTTDTWTQKADMPAPRESLSTSVVNGKIYAIGGYRNGSHLSTVEEYDPVMDTWTKKTDMPAARDVVSTSVVNGKIYSIGGQSENAWPAFSTVEVYDPVTDTWASKADMPAPRSALSTSVVNGKIYAFGGTASRGGAPQSTLFQYDPATDTWTIQDDMPARMLGMSTSVVGGRIYVIGGTSASYPYSSRLSTVWEYDIGLRFASPDFNGDGVVDDADATIMVEYWHTDDPLCDIAPEPWGDGIVDVQDMAALIEHLGPYTDDPTLVAHWAMDEAQGTIAYDSASQNDAFLIGGPVWQPNGGQVDGAIQLDGIDDAIIGPAPLNPSAGPFSAIAWVKGGAPGQAIISEPGGSNWLSLDVVEGRLMTELAGFGRSSGPLLSEITVTDDQWHRIAFVWDGSHRMLISDGVMVAQDMQDSLISPGNGFYIGTGKAMAPGTYFSGLIDEVRIYDRVVSP